MNLVELLAPAKNLESGKIAINYGADALIIQDMGIIEMNIPPIPLHASTQTNNYNSERIRFLDEIGQHILADSYVE